MDRAERRRQAKLEKKKGKKLNIPVVPTTAPKKAPVMKGELTVRAPEDK